MFLVCSWPDQYFFQFSWLFSLRDGDLICTAFVSRVPDCSFPFRQNMIQCGFVKDPSCFLVLREENKCAVLVHSRWHWAFQPHYLWTSQDKFQFILESTTVALEVKPTGRWIKTKLLSPKAHGVNIYLIGFLRTKPTKRTLLCNERLNHRSHFPCFFSSNMFVAVAPPPGQDCSVAVQFQPVERK